MLERFKIRFWGERTTNFTYVCRGNTLEIAKAAGALWFQHCTGQKISRVEILGMGPHEVA